MRLQKGFDPVVNRSRPEEASKNLFFLLWPVTDFYIFGRRESKDDTMRPTLYSVAFDLNASSYMVSPKE